MTDTNDREPAIVYLKDLSGDRSDLLDAVVEALDAKAARLGAKHRVAGIATGGCIEAVGTGRMGSFRRQAHAHTNAGDIFRDWICVLARRPERLLTATGRPTRLLIHEVAHIATQTGHDHRWRFMVGRLGAPSEARNRSAS